MEDGWGREKRVERVWVVVDENDAPDDDLPSKTIAKDWKPPVPDCPFCHGTGILCERYEVGTMRVEEFKDNCECTRLTKH